MRAAIQLTGAGLAVLTVLWACDEAPPPAGPSDGATASAAAPSFAAAGRRILMLDQCDPESFNAAIGPETCVNRNGGITFDQFIAQLARNQRAPSWRFSPDVIHVPREQTLGVANLGGEVHTFTEVAEFGGGFVQELNELTGTPDPAPECLNFDALEFIPSGGEASHTFSPGEVEKFQCCIHPWMRAVTR